MKRNQILFALLLVGSICSSNISQAQTRAGVGIRAGANFFNVVSKDNEGNKTLESTLNPGFHFGLTLDFDIADQFGLQTGLLFSQKGFQAEAITPKVTTATSATAHYFELPVNLIFKPKLGSGKLLLGAGPYAAYGVGGRFLQTVKEWMKPVEDADPIIVTTKVNKKLQFLDDVGDAEPNKVFYGKPLDYGANLLAGYELKNGLSAQLNAQLGLANLNPSNNGVKSGFSFKNVGFGVSLGYKF